MDKPVVERSKFLIFYFFTETKDNKIFKYEDYIFDNIHLKQKPHKQFLEETLKNVDNL